MTGVQTCALPIFSDRIELVVATDAATAAAVTAHRAYVQDQVLATRLEFGDFGALGPGMHAGSGRVGSGDGAVVRFGLRKG